MNQILAGMFFIVLDLRFELQILRTWHTFLIIDNCVVFWFIHIHWSFSIWAKWFPDGYICDKCCSY